MADFIDTVINSTNYDKRYASNNLMRTYQLEYADGSLEERIDYSDWRYTSIIKRLRKFTPYTYNGFEKFTAIVKRYYGNTTIYRLVLTFNGFMHPYEIPRGAVIKLFDPLELKEQIQKLNNKKQGASGRSVLV